MFVYISFTLGDRAPGVAPFYVTSKVRVLTSGRLDLNSRAEFLAKVRSAQNARSGERRRGMEKARVALASSQSSAVPSSHSFVSATAT